MEGGGSGARGVQSQGRQAGLAAQVDAGGPMIRGGRAEGSSGGGGRRNSSKAAGAAGHR